MSTANSNMVPVNISDMVKHLYDNAFSESAKDNYCLTLENIRNYCTQEIQKYNTRKAINKQNKR